MTTPLPGPGASLDTPAPSPTPLPATPPATQEPAQPQSAFNPQTAPGHSFKLNDLFPKASAAAVAEPPAPAPADQPPAAPGETPAQPPADSPEKFGSAVLEQLKREYRAEYPTDSQEIIDRLASKELDRRRQQSEKSRLLTRIMKGENELKPPPLTKFEQQFAEPPAPAPAAAPPAAAAPEPVRPASAGALPEMPEYMKSRESAAEELSIAMSSGDTAKVAEVLSNINAVEAFLREKQLRDEFRTLLDERLKPVDEMQNQRLAEQDIDFAIAEVEQIYPDVRKLFNPLSESILDVNGRNGADNLLNRLAIRYPHLGHVFVHDADPTTSRRLTNIARYRAAYELAESFLGKETPLNTPPSQPAATGTSPVQTAPPVPAPNGTPLPFSMDQIVASVRQVLEREVVDRARQGLNAGQGASGSPSGSQSGIDLQGPPSVLNKLIAMRR